MTKYYKLNLATLPDHLFSKDTPAQKWLDLATTTENSFPPNSLNRVHTPIEPVVELERIFGISLYMIGNVLPFALVILSISSLFSAVAYLLLKVLAIYVTALTLLTKLYFTPKFSKKYKRPDLVVPHDMKDNQYVYTERNNQKYCSLQILWPESLHRPSMSDQPLIFCAIPHGAAPLGITAYPMWSKLFNDKLCHWTTAPIVLKLPIISKLMKAIGYIPAKSKNILETLSKKEENVGIVLDGIAGMFQSHDEIAHVMQRKGIVKIALKAGVPLVPVYGFGHTELWRVVVDPVGILESLSVKLDVSLTPFFGRFGWFLGPPKRVAVAMCMGEPISCPKIENPSQEDVNKYHDLLVKGYEEVFERHKEAYGWGHKTLRFV